VPHENSAARKVRPLLHQVKDRAFSLVANDGHVGEVDDQFAPADVLNCIPLGCAKLGNPRSDEGSFHEQRALVRHIGDGYPEHVYL
jgi:hypothetical protein